MSIEKIKKQLPAHLRNPIFGLSLICAASLFLIYAWYSGILKNATAVLIRILHPIAPVAGAIGIIIFIRSLVKYIRDPEGYYKEVLDAYKKRK